jgi:hypothetical protein
MKREMRDVVSSTGKSIRRIPVERTPRVKPQRRSFGGSIGKGGGVSNMKIGNNKNGRFSRFGVWVIAGVSLLILFFVISLLFGGAKVEITPRQESVVIDGVFKAFREGMTGELDFEVMTITRSVSKEVEATGEEFVEEKASGKITIFNNYGTASQRLIKNTRFETPDGLIYRIKDAVTVPGRTTVGGSTVPGSLEVTVYADKEGPKYNAGLTDFTIPGLKGDPRFSKIFARSKTVMTGGVSGVVRKASASDLAAARSSLDKELNAKLLEEALSVKPEGFLLLNNSYIINSEAKTENSSGDKVLVTEEGTFYGFIFDEGKFAEFVGINTIATYTGGKVELIGTEDLEFNILDASSISPESEEELSFSLSGPTKVVWSYDELALREDLAGQSKKRIEIILVDYPSINQAEVTLRPFWKRSFPDDGSKIKIKKIIN